MNDEVVYFVDPRCSGQEHIEVNKAVIISFLRKGGYKKFKIIAEPKYTRDLVREVGDLSFAEHIPDIESWHIQTVSNRLSLIKNEIILWCGIRKILSLSKNKVIVIYLTASLISICIGKELARSEKVVFFSIIHGDLEKIGSKAFYKSFIYQNVIKFGLCSYNNLLVFTDYIKENLAKFIGDKSKFVESLDIPLIQGNTLAFRKFKNQSAASHNRKIVVSCLGIGDYSKNTDKFFGIAERVSQKSDRIEFCYAGRIINKELADSIPKLVNVIGGSLKYLPRNTYIEQLLRSDFVLIPYSPDTYKFSFSGVLSDAISFGVPVISLGGPMIQEIESRIRVKMYTFSDIKEIEEFLSSESSLIDQRYRVIQGQIFQYLENLNCCNNFRLR